MDESINCGYNNNSIIQCRIDENKSLLEYAKLHMDERAILVISDRINELEKELQFTK